MHGESSDARATGRAILDSPWAWVLMFSVMGLVALAAMRPKYLARQGEIEMEYTARQRSDEFRARRAAGEEPAAEGRKADPVDPRAPLIIPLWPLAATLSLIALASLGMLLRRRGPVRRIKP